MRQANFLSSVICTNAKYLAMALSYMNFSQITILAMDDFSGVSSSRHFSISGFKASPSPVIKSWYFALLIK